MHTPQWRPPTPEEQQLLQREVSRLRENLVKHIAGWPREGWMLCGIALALMPVFWFIPYKHDGPMLRWVILVILSLFFAIGVAGSVLARRRMIARIAEFNSLNAPRLEKVQDWKLSPRRVVAVSDGDGMGMDWWLFELEGGWLLLSDEGSIFNLELGEQSWREQNCITLDALGVTMAVRGEGAEVPFLDLRLKAPDFAVDENSIFWCPPEDCDTGGLLTEAQVQSGRLPPGPF